MQTLPQNGENRVSVDLKFQNVPGEEAKRHQTHSSENLDPRQQVMIFWPIFCTDSTLCYERLVL